MIALDVKLPTQPGIDGLNDLSLGVDQPLVFRRELDLLIATEHRAETKAIAMPQNGSPFDTDERLVAEHIQVRMVAQ